MRTKPLVCALLIASTLLAGPAPLARAESRRSAFSQNSVEALMTDYYKHFGAPKADGGALTDLMASPPLTEADKSEYALDVLDEILLLPTPLFNDVILHAMADYRQHPEHREAIERLAASVAMDRSTDAGADALRRTFREDLAANPTVSFVQTVLDDAVIAFGAAYAFQFGRGIWRGVRGVDSTGITRFKAIRRYVSYSMFKLKKARFATFGVGSAAGLAQAVAQSFESRKQDPRRMLSAVQCGDSADRCQDTPADARSVACAAAVEAASMRDELRRMVGESPETLRANNEAYRSRITEMDNAVTRMQREMEHLYDVAPHCRSRLEPIADDLTEVRKNVPVAATKLDRSDLGGGMLR